MTNSTIKSFFRTASAQTAGDEPVDAAIHQLGVMQSMAHLCDEGMQVRVNMASRAGAYLTHDAPTSATAWYQIGIFGPFPMTLQPDRTACLFRVRLAGFSDKGGAVKWRLGVAPFEDAVSTTQATIDTNAMEFTTSSLTTAWIDPSGPLTIPAYYVAAAQRTINSLIAVGGTANATVGITAMCAVVFGQAPIGDLAKMTGLYVAEYTGP